MTSLVLGKWCSCHCECACANLCFLLSSDDNVFEDEEVNEYYEPEVGENEDQDLDDGDEQHNIVVSGDPSAAANATKGDKSSKDKKIPDDERTTTPYMTKYERARILGTRALQIRYASFNVLRSWKTD